MFTFTINKKQPMKKIYLTILTSLFILGANAQLSLTKTFNEPVVGDVNYKTGFDTLAALPNTSGTNQMWDFSALTPNFVLSNTTYTTVASTPNGANYPSATLADDDGQGTYTYYKSTTTQFEMVGIDDPNVTLNFTNTAIAAIWPVTYGYTNTDAFAGSAMSGTMTGTANGTITTVAQGSGTLMLPGGITLTNVLQVKSNQKVNISLFFGFVTATLTAVQYDYYEGTQKFPIVTVSYNDLQGAITNTSATVKMNDNVITGITDNNFDASFNVFPNPAKDNFTVQLSNVKNDAAKIEIINAVGSVAKTVSLGNNSQLQTNITITDLTTGIYMVKTTVGDKVSVRKLIVE